jgi:uncharacterized membrane protein (UPF0127 family)
MTMGFFDGRWKAMWPRSRERRAGRGEVRIKVVNLTRQTQIADRVGLAGDGRNRRKGLLGRAGLAEGEGLWIVPCEAVHTFWMRFPIDLVYLDRKYRVIKIRTGVRPWRLSACLRAHSVIELAAGTMESTRTAPGDVLALERCREVAS